jgi:hypothetical protein
MTTCPGCSRPVDVGRTETGQRILLDPDSPTYDLVIFEASRGDYRITRSLTVRVAHRSVCKSPPVEPGSSAAPTRGKGGRG